MRTRTPFASAARSAPPLLSTRPVARPVARLLACLALAAPASAQAFETAASHAGDPAFHQPDHALVFVASQGHADAVTDTPPHFGLDVHATSNPAAHGPGGGLYVLMPDGAVRKLFPLPAHEGVPGLIDTPLGALHKGAIAEPTVSEDGRTLYFAYFHDATWEPSAGGFQSRKLSYKGCDLYRLDVGLLLDEPDVDPASLPVRRLTTKQYTGPARSDVLQTDADRLKDALNPRLAQQAAGANYWGTMDMHLIEVRTEAGLEAVWVSNRARLANSNEWFGEANHNFNLYRAPILADGSLGPANQFLHYTTTAGLSPTPLRTGFAFSYQSSTEDGRRWEMQAIDSEGRWSPLLGYAHSSELFHLGTLVVERDASGALVDSFVGVKYYNANNGGFGQLHKIRLADAGTNEFELGPWGTSPRQLSELLTLGVVAADVPSPRVTVGGVPRYVGKFSSPRAGRVGGELYMAYTPTSANVSRLDADGRTNVFESEIRYRPGLASFEPHEPIDPALGRGLYTVVRDASALYDLFWPTPILSWLERAGEPAQRTARPIADRRNAIPPGEPKAEIGSPALWNSDIRPFDCYILGSRPFNPNHIHSNEEVQVLHSQEGLRYVADPSDPCGYLVPERVLGVAVELTGHRTDFQALNTRGYETDGTGKVETVTQLGVYSVLDHNVADQSFKVRVPANVPFELQLLDRRYGMKLADVRSWHSLKPRETRTDCSGCHQHEAGFEIPFEGSEASQKPAFDLTGRTTYVDYDADCRPVVRTSEAPTLPVPEWKADIWPGFQQHCGGCHDVVRSVDTDALLAFDFGTEEDAYDKLIARNYAGSDLGALGSPAFWAAYGERTDGRDNDVPDYQPDYANGEWGYHFSNVHASAPGLCAAANPEWASWVRRLGQWIDHHMPRDTGATVFGAKYDRYAPTVDVALSSDLASLEVGYWDDGGTVALVLEWNGAALASFASLANGATSVALPAGWTRADQVRVVVSDPTDNRQVLVKSLGLLLDERPGPDRDHAVEIGALDNARPHVSILQPSSGTEHPTGTPLGLAGRATDLEDGNLSARIAWSSDRAGSLGSGAVLEVVLLEPGIHRIRAEVADTGGRSAFDEIELELVEALNQPPTVTIEAPLPGALFTAGSSIDLRARASDPEDDDGVLSSTIAWSSSLDGPLGSGATLTVADLSVGEHLVTASVTDSGGASASDGVLFEVAAPPGLPAGLVLHLEGSQGILGTGDTVTGWIDLSGRANHLTAAGDPVRTTTPSGAPAIRLDLDDRLERIDAQTPIVGLPEGNAERTMFLVARYEALTWSSGAAYGAGAGNMAFGLGLRHPAGLLMLQGFGGDNDLVSSTPGLGAGWLVQSAVLAAGTATLYRAGTPVAQWSHTYQTGRARIVIGQEIGNFGNVALDVAALLVFERALAPAEHAAVLAYLEQEYLAPTAPDAPPTLAILAPAPGSSFELGQPVTLEASAADAEDGELSQAILWSSDRDGPLGAGATLTLTSLAVGPHAITAAVTDSAGHTAVASLSLEITTPGAIVPGGQIALFDGQQLTGLEPWFSGAGHADPNAVFRVEDGLLHVTGEGWGALASAASYRDYAMVLEFRWGETTWPPRQGNARDAGLMIHGHGVEGGWNGLLLASLQAQMMEGSTGDLVLLQGSAPMSATAFAGQVPCTFDTWNCRGGHRWDPAGFPLDLTLVPGTTLHWSRWDPDWVDVAGFRGDEDVERPHGEWNQLVVLAAGDSVEVWLNGVQVNEALGVTPSAGRVQLEVEYAEFYVRRWELLPLGAGVGPTIATAELPRGLTGSAYSGAFSAVGGTLPLTWTLASGVLPPALTLAPSGTLTGTPESEGSFPFVVRVTDATGLSAEAGFELAIDPAGGLLPAEGLVLRLESSEFVSAGPVGSWSDLSGRGNHVFALGGPEVVLGATPSGEPALRLDGLDDRLERVHATHPLVGLPVGNADRTVFLVARYENSTASAGVAYGHGASNQAFGLMIRHPSGFLALQGFGGDQDLVSSTQGTGAGWLTQSAVLAGGQARLFKDGAQIAQWSHAYATTLARLVIGEELAGLGFIGGQVGAVLVYDRALDDSDRNAVESYLAAKYLTPP